MGEVRGSHALEGKGPQRRPQKRLDRRLAAVVRAVRGGYCRLQMPLRLALGVRGTVAGHRLGALEGGGGGFQCFAGQGSEKCSQTPGKWWRQPPRKRERMRGPAPQKVVAPGPEKLFRRAPDKMVAPAAEKMVAPDPEKMRAPSPPPPPPEKMVVLQTDSDWSEPEPQMGGPQGERVGL